MPRPVTLSLELLQTFVLLVDNKGDAMKTAEELDINQPSMSKRLRFLQHSGRVLTHPWLVRAGKTWELTEEGERVLPAVREIIYRYQQLTDFTEPPKSVQPRARLACGQEAVVGIVKRALRELRKMQESLSEEERAQVRISTIRGRARIEGVASGTLDLAIVTHDEAAIQKIARRQLHVEELMTEQLALVCAEDAPWADRFAKLLKTKAPAESLLQFPLILPEPNAGIRKTVDRILKDKGLLADQNVVLEIGGWATILSFVREGFGVGLVGTGALGSREGLIVRLMDPEVIPPTKARLICRRIPGSKEGLDLSAGARLFYEALKKVAGK